MRIIQALKSPLEQLYMGGHNNFQIVMWIVLPVRKKRFSVTNDLIISIIPNQFRLEVSIPGELISHQISMDVFNRILCKLKIVVPTYYFAQDFFMVTDLQQTSQILLFNKFIV